MLSIVFLRIHWHKLKKREGSTKQKGRKPRKDNKKPTMRQVKEAGLAAGATGGTGQHKAQMRTKARTRRAKALKKARNEENRSLPKHICRCEYARRGDEGHSQRTTKDRRSTKESKGRRNKSPNGPSKGGHNFGGKNVPGRGGPSGLPQERRDGEGSLTA